jgi:hypothetical protein
MGEGPDFVMIVTERYVSDPEESEVHNYHSRPSANQTYIPSVC